MPSPCCCLFISKKRNKVYRIRFPRINFFRVTICTGICRVVYGFHRINEYVISVSCTPVRAFRSTLLPVYFRSTVPVLCTLYRPIPGTDLVEGRRITLRSPLRETTDRSHMSSKTAAHISACYTGSQRLLLPRVNYYGHAASRPISAAGTAGAAGAATKAKSAPNARSCCTRSASTARCSESRSSEGSIVFLEDRPNERSRGEVLCAAVATFGQSAPPWCRDTALRHQPGGTTRSSSRPGAASPQTSPPASLRACPRLRATTTQRAQRPPPGRPERTSPRASRTSRTQAPPPICWSACLLPHGTGCWRSPTCMSRALLRACRKPPATSRRASSARRAAM